MLFKCYEWAMLMKPNYSKNKEDNRAKYPEVAKFIDEVRKHFPGARVVSIKPAKDKPTDKK